MFYKPRRQNCRKRNGRGIFDYMAPHIECRLNKNSLLQCYFLAIFVFRLSRSSRGLSQIRSDHFEKSEKYKSLCLFLFCHRTIKLNSSICPRQVRCLLWRLSTAHRVACTTETTRLHQLTTKRQLGTLVTSASRKSSKKICLCIVVATEHCVPIVWKVPLNIIKTLPEISHVR